MKNVNCFAKITQISITVKNYVLKARLRSNNVLFLRHECVRIIHVYSSYLADLV